MAPKTTPPQARWPPGAHHQQPWRQQQQSPLTGPAAPLPPHRLWEAPSTHLQSQLQPQDDEEQLLLAQALQHIRLIMDLAAVQLCLAE